MGGWASSWPTSSSWPIWPRSARTQYFLLGAEIITLIVFSAVALGRVVFGDVEGSVTPSLSWLSPFAIDSLAGSPLGSWWPCSSTGAGTRP
jgi:hypothetical protein